MVSECAGGCSPPCLLRLDSLWTAQRGQRAPGVHLYLRLRAEALMPTAVPRLFYGFCFVFRAMAAFYVCTSPSLTVLSPRPFTLPCRRGSEMIQGQPSSAVSLKEHLSFFPVSISLVSFCCRFCSERRGPTQALHILGEHPCIEHFCS